jgi:hypothetical protein
MSPVTSSHDSITSTTYASHVEDKQPVATSHARGTSLVTFSHTGQTSPTYASHVGDKLLTSVSHVRDR